RALSDDGFLGLDEVSDVHALAELGAGTQMRERTDDRLVADLRIADDDAEAEMHAVAELRVAQVRAAINPAVLADPGLAAQLHVRADHRARADRDSGLGIERVGVLEDHSGFLPPPRDFATLVFAHSHPDVRCEQREVKVASDRRKTKGTLRRERPTFPF